ncbi:mucin-5AC-like [Ranitomeya imitator]|uniref:mucin-5AC-like n=1 Tax=Ranitomeya imitator TaxID=111125 RepID=UPI0037E7564A
MLDAEFARTHGLACCTLAKPIPIFPINSALLAQKALTQIVHNMDPEKIRAVLDWDCPEDLTALQLFLDFTNFYQKFIQNYSKGEKANLRHLLQLLISCEDQVGKLAKSAVYQRVIFRTVCSLKVLNLLNPAHNDHVCSTWGNYHYKTFDGDIYQFPGTCNYIFASNCINTCEDFNIQIRHSVESGKTVLSYVRVKIDWLVIEMRKGKITIGEESVSLPYSQLGVQIQQTSVYVKLTAKLGLTLLWNNEDALMLKLSPKYMNTTCGLCGNMNGVSQDEFRIDDMILTPVQYANMQKLDGPTEQCEDVYFSTPENCSELKPSPPDHHLNCNLSSDNMPKIHPTTKAWIIKRLKTRSIAEVASTFNVSQHQVQRIQKRFDETRDVFDKSRSGTPRKTTAQEEHLLEQVCVQMLSSPAFRDCDVRVPKIPYIQACISDLCICQSSNKTSCVCDTLAEYSRQCVHAGGRPRNWRNNICEIRCPMNLKYDECGSPCADTCSNCERTLVCEDPCMDGCFCPPGTVLDDVNNKGCIPFSECPCTYNRRIYAPGESFSNNCQKCICQGGQWDCRALPCPGHCSLEGGSHIYTYDGGHYNFHGDCSYIFTKDCVENMFNVVVELRKCGNTHTETCLRSVTLFLEKGLTVITVKYSGAVLLNGIYAPVPLYTDNFALFQPSSFYMIVKSLNGIQMQIQLEPIMQLSVSLDPDYMGNACGLCGDFNNIRTDDFRAANGVLEGTASAFANSWKSFGNCADVKDSYENPCSLSMENERFAQHWCSLLLDSNGPFAPCHTTVNPTIYQTNCMYDSCNYEKSEDSVCAALGSYVRACAAEGVILEQWRDAICDKYTKKCSKNSTYHYSIRTCQKTCRSLSEPDPSCKFKFPSVDGCACPSGTYLDDSGACVPAKQCPCYYKGSIVLPGEVIYDYGAMCTCQSGRLYCIGKVPIHTVCPTNMVYFDCANASVGEKGAECQKTCQTLDLECFSIQCTSGCICPDDLVLNNHGRCIPEKKCPCVHNGEVYYSGETIQQDCNTCTCKDRKWQCTKKECDKTCVVYGEGHYVTFDGKRFDFSGDCEYTLTQDYCNSGNQSFRVITENIQCGTTGATCSKAIKIFLGIFELKLSESSYEVLERDVGSEVPYQVRQLGMFLVIEANIGLIIMWDKKTTIFIKLGPKFQGHVCGLCGNYDGNVLNDFTTRSQSVVVDVLEFGNSWKASPSCPDALPLTDPCHTNPYRQTWSQKHCSIIMGSTFFKCHSKLDPSPYYEACVHDTCACDSGGDCECFCTAVAAYAAACSQAGICVSWRTPEICPLFCDYYNPEGECEWHYKPCGDPCIRTCRNPSGQCMNYLPGLEGCYPNCPKKRPFFDEDIMKCVAQMNCGCYDNDGKRYNVGDVVPSYKNCESCACTKKGLRCQMDVRACYCYYGNIKYNYGDIIYSTTDGIGECIIATCSSDGKIKRRVYPCVSSTTSPTTTFHFETSSKIPLNISTPETPAQIRSSWKSLQKKTSPASMP